MARCVRSESVPSLPRNLGCVWFEDEPGRLIEHHAQSAIIEANSPSEFHRALPSANARHLFW